MILRYSLAGLNSCDELLKSRREKISAVQGEACEDVNRKSQKADFSQDEPDLPVASHVCLRRHLPCLQIRGSSTIDSINRDVPSKPVLLVSSFSR